MTDVRNQIGTDTEMMDLIEQAIRRLDWARSAGNEEIAQKEIHSAIWRLMDAAGLLCETLGWDHHTTGRFTLTTNRKPVQS